MARNGCALWGQCEETYGRTQERFGELGPQEHDGGGSVAKMEAPLLNPLDIICHMRSPCTLDTQQVLNK